VKTLLLFSLPDQTKSFRCHWQNFGCFQSAGVRRVTWKMSAGEILLDPGASLSPP
jgi:hypothetical protein